MSTFGSLQAQLERLKQQGKGGASDKRQGLKTFVPVYAPKATAKAEDESADSAADDTEIEDFAFGVDGGDYDDDGNLIETDEDTEESETI